MRLNQRHPIIAELDALQEEHKVTGLRSALVSKLNGCPCRGCIRVPQHTRRLGRLGLPDVHIRSERTRHLVLQLEAYRFLMGLDYQWVYTSTFNGQV